MNNGFITQIGGQDSWGLFLQILATHLVEVPGPLSRDRILQRVLDAQMKFRYPEKYNRLHKFAAKLYARWLQGKDIDGNELESGKPTGTDQICFIVEHLYHLCHSIGDAEDRRREVEEWIKRYLDELRYPGGLQAGRLALRKAVDQDEELSCMLRQLMGPSGYQIFLEHIMTD